MIIKDALDAFVGEREWNHDRSKTVGSSEIGGCERRVWYVKHKQKPDTDFNNRWGASERGNIIEANLLAPAMQEKYGDSFVFSGKNQRTFFLNHLSATPDGLLRNQPTNALRYLGVKNIKGDLILVEFKTLDPRVNLSEAKHQNMLQVQTAMGLLRESGWKKLNYALLVYINASFLDDITEFAIEFDKKIFAIASQRATRIIEAKSATEMKPEGWIEGGQECEHCPFLKSCGIERHNLPNDKYNGEIDLQLRAEFVDLVRSANELKNVADKSTSVYKAAQEVIKERLREKDIRKIKGVLDWQFVKGRKSMDYEALEKAAQKKGLDISKFETVGQPTSRLMLMDC
jgi:hypothetical protein